MNAFLTKLKVKGYSVMNKIVNSEAYRKADKAVVCSGVALAVPVMTALTTFAAETDNTILNSISVDEDSILNYTQPFVSPAITVLCVVGGIKLGMSFLKRAFH